MIRITVNLTPGQYARLRALSREQGRPMSWFVWRGLARHTIPAYGAEESSGGQPWDDGGTSKSCTFTLPDHMEQKLAEFADISGRGISWAVRSGLEEHVFSTYESPMSAV